MEASDARRLKALEDENTKLKKLLAEAMLDNAMLRDVAAPARSRNANESAAQCGSSSDSPLEGDGFELVVPRHDSP